MRHGPHAIRALVLTAAVVVTGVACGTRQARFDRQPEATGETLVVLLPDPDSGHVGHVRVSNSAGRTELDTAGESTRVLSRQAPGPATTLSQSEVQALFGETLDALPPAQRHFTLFFEFDSEELTADSRALAPEILRTVRERPMPEVLIVGHTDTSGPRATNFTLGLRRANRVHTILRDAGLDLMFVDIVSHGETDLLVPTSDGVFEARNRRVDITIR